MISIRPALVLASSANAVAIDAIPSPQLSTMASDQNTRQSVIDREWRRKPAFNGNERIDPSIAGNVQFAWRPLSAKICGCKLGWREQQVGTGVDRSPVFLLRPREERVVGSETCLHVCYRDARGESRKRAPQRTRGVALHDDEVRGRLQSRKACG
jgi:hypothetical protein